MKKLYDTWFGYHKVFDYIPKFSRKGKALSQPQVKSKDLKQDFLVNLYASFVKGPFSFS